MTPIEVAAAQVDVLQWAENELRDLPWRASRDPWEILVAEVMSQQTQLQRVIPKWHAFLQRWPTAQACSNEPLAEILKAWSGLGYPRRARALWETAQRVTHEFDGEFPMDYDALITMPGIGPYTANAMLCFAGERDVGLVDTNIGRILARVINVRLTAKQAQHQAESLVPTSQGWLWNQALLDIGALLCRSEPICHQCPLAPSCLWHRNGNLAPDPAHKSAGVSVPQSAFQGSFRQDRGAVLRLMESGPITTAALVQSLQLSRERIEEVLASLVGDQLIERDHGGDHYQLGWTNLDTN